MRGIVHAVPHSGTAPLLRRPCAAAPSLFLATLSSPSEDVNSQHAPPEMGPRKRAAPSGGPKRSMTPKGLPFPVPVRAPVLVGVLVCVLVPHVLSRVRGVLKRTCKTSNSKSYRRRPPVLGFMPRVFLTGIARHTAAWLPQSLPCSGPRPAPCCSSNPCASGLHGTPRKGEGLCAFLLLAHCSREAGAATAPITLKPTTTMISHGPAHELEAYKAPDIFVAEQDSDEHDPWD